MTDLFDASMMSISGATEKDRAFLDEVRANHHGGLTVATLEAMRALGKIGPAASPAIPLLSRFADSQGWRNWLLISS